jgi:hypothetical protein
MSLSRDSKQEKKVKAILRAQFALKQRLERIEWDEETLIPTVQALKAGKSILGLEAGVVFDIQPEESHADLQAQATTEDEPLING